MDRLSYLILADNQILQVEIVLFSYWSSRNTHALVCCENDPQRDQPTVGLSSVVKDYVIPDVLLYQPGYDGN